MDVTEVAKISGVSAVASEVDVAKPVNALSFSITKRALRKRVRGEKPRLELAPQVAISNPSDLGSKVDTLA